MKKELIIVQTFDKYGFLIGIKANGELVRCKDCKYLSHDRIAPEFNRVCRQSGAGKPDYGFCDDGERKSE